jgi:hypothetical protein
MPFPAAFAFNLWFSRMETAGMIFHLHTRTPPTFGTALWMRKRMFVCIFLVLARKWRSDDIRALPHPYYAFALVSYSSAYSGDAPSHFRAGCMEKLHQVKTGG